MASTSLKFGIPDIELRYTNGRSVNPSSFAGHELIVLFVPLDASDAASEIETYSHHCAEFVERDAWLLTFAEHFDDLIVDGGRRVLTIPDPDCRAWKAFRSLAEEPEKLDRKTGAVFLFTRGGNLHCCWSGPGHLEGLLAELRTPLSQHHHQG